jgi:hypothetical protein
LRNSVMVLSMPSTLILYLYLKRDKKVHFINTLKITKALTMCC